jgi:quercetin dioxygenase-like cupin family protein
MSKVEALPKDALSEGAPSPGITRHLAFKGDGFQVIRSRVAPGVMSGWHHHGDYDVYGYVVSGSARFESGNGGGATTVGPGDFFHVPPHTIHRDGNPSPDEEEVVILFLQGTGSMVTNVDGPGQA